MALAGEGVDEQAATGKKSNRRRRKKEAAAVAAEDDAVEQLSGTVIDMAQKQRRVKDLYKQHASLQQSLDTLSSRTANTPRGHTMLYDRKKKLIEQMEALLDEIAAINKATPGVGSVAGLRALEAQLSDVVIGAGDSASLAAALGDVQKDCDERRARAEEVAASLRAARLAAREAEGGGAAVGGAAGAAELQALSLLTSGQGQNVELT